MAIRNIPKASENAKVSNMSTTENPPNLSRKLSVDNIDNSEAQVVVPQDSGWSWLVMVASFLCCTVIDGIVFCSGLIQDSILEDFNVSKGYVAFVSSLLSGCYLMAGPFVSALANRFGFRPVTIVGALFAAFSFGISYYAFSVEFLFITYGICGGIGFCMVYIPAVVIIGFYFEKWRALATGLALCGSGVGTFLFAPLTNIFLKLYGWRGTLLIQGGIVLTCAICGLVFRPIKPITLSRKGIEEDCERKANGRENPNSAAALNTTPFNKPLPEGRFAYSMPNSAHNTYMGGSPKHHYPTASEVFRGVNIERRLSSSGANGKATEMKSLRKSQPSTPNGEVQQFSFNINKELSPVGENDEETENQNLLQPDCRQMQIQGRRHTVSGRRPNDIIAKKLNTHSHDTNQHPTASRPMYRDDIFFTGSLTRIPQYQSQSSLAYHMSVTRLPTKQDILEDRQSGCKLCPEAVRRILATMLDTSLLRSPSFMLLAFSGFLTMMGFFVPFTFLVRRAIEAGIDKSSALSIVSGIGFVNTIARIVCGMMSSMPSIKPLWLNNIAITAGGIATMLSGIIITKVTQWSFALLFGICIACFSALRSLIAVELIGLEKLTNAFGFLMLFQGLAAAIGTPIAGALYDMTGSYDVSFYFAGSLILLSAFLCYPLNWVANWEKSHQEKLSA